MESESVAHETEEWLLQLRDDCERVGRSVAKKYSAVEADDLVQELFLAAWTARDNIKSRNRWLNRVASAIGYKMHDKAMKSTYIVQYEYTAKMLEGILESTFFYDMWGDLTLPDSARSAPVGNRPVYSEAGGKDIYQSVNDPTDSIDVCVDIQVTLDQMSISDRLVLIKRYKYGIQPANESAEYKQLRTALNRLTWMLNSYRGQKFKNRRAISNSQAMARIGTQYGG